MQETVHALSQEVLRTDVAGMPLEWIDYRVAATHLSGKLGVPTVELRCPKYHSFEINITRARTVLGYAPENDFFRMADRAIEARKQAT